MVNNDQIFERIDSISRYAQLGGSWRADRLQADWMAGLVDAEASRMQWRSNFALPVGAVRVSLLPGGWWLAGLPNDIAARQRDPAQYGVLEHPTDLRQPALSRPTRLTLANPRIMERRETTFKVDLRYAPGDVIPFLRRLKFGASWRGYDTARWTGEGYTVRAARGETPAVVVPRVALSSTFQACEDTPGSLGTGGTPCRYGSFAGSQPANVRSTAIVMPQAQFQAIAGAAMGRQTIGFFRGLVDRPAGLIEHWTGIDVPRLVAATGVPNFNLDCMKHCQASDGKVYEQPVFAVRERITAAYLSADVDAGQLAGGGELSGNLGVRVVHTGVDAARLITFRSLAQGAAVDSLARNTTIRGAGTDLMPMLNLAWWPAPERLVLRYARAKMIARPAVEYLYGSALSCSYDSASAPQIQMTCEGTMGNPDLKPLTSWNDNLAGEWYPDHDTLLSLSLFRQRGVTGAPIRVAVSGAMPFAGSGARDPASERDLSDVRYAYATWTNGPAVRRNGIEGSVRSAFTGLPSLLRYTGIDASYTRLRSRGAESALRDLVTGAPLAPAGEMKYTWNGSLWYDDGALRARLAVQSAAASFREIPPQAANYPAPGTGTASALPYNPASATFRDAARFIDAKLSYRFANGIELFAEGRNLGRATVSGSQGAVQPYADGTPNLLDRAYYGAQYLVGVTIRR